MRNSGDAEQRTERSGVQPSVSLLEYSTFFIETFQCLQPVPGSVLVLVLFSWIASPSARNDERGKARNDGKEEGSQ